MSHDFTLQYNYDNLKTKLLNNNDFFNWIDLQVLTDIDENDPIIERFIETFDPFEIFLLKVYDFLIYFPKKTDQQKINILETIDSLFSYFNVEEIFFFMPQFLKSRYYFLLCLEKSIYVEQNEKIKKKLMHLLGHLTSQLKNIVLIKPLSLNKIIETNQEIFLEPRVKLLLNKINDLNK